MKNNISEILRRVEQEHDVRIVYACESGSRAWGFASTDSDYDVRFIYAHAQSWYLGILEKRDVIELPEKDNIDANGWDIRKALQLLLKSNPPLIEWLTSPIVYYERHTYSSPLKTLAAQYYSEKTCLFHYLHMAEGNYREYLRNEVVWLKKYFYVLRPLLACQWIMNGKGIVPVRFQELLTVLDADSQVRKEIEFLVARKLSGQELDKGTKIQVLNDYVESQIDKIKQVAPKSTECPSTKPLDEYYSWVISTILKSAA